MFARFRNTLYVRIQAEQIAILHVESERELIESPALAIETTGKQPKIVAVGQAALALAGREGLSICNGFRHPRTLLADFNCAEQTLKHLVKQALPKSLFLVSPIIVLHPQAKLEGGLTPIETRAFAELGTSVGGRQVYVWVGADLTREQLLSLNFPRTTGQLLFP